MAIQHGPEAIVVDLPDRPGLEEELEELLRLVRSLVTCAVLMDFSRVTILNSTCLAALVRVRNHLQEHGGRLVLCSVGMQTHGILAVTGLTGIFEIADDKVDALATIRCQARTACL